MRVFLLITPTTLVAFFFMVETGILSFMIAICLVCNGMLWLMRLLHANLCIALKIYAHLPYEFLSCSCVKLQRLLWRFEVKGYPTLFWFKHGQRFEYEGGRVKDAIVEYMKERAAASWQPPPRAAITLTASNFSATTSKKRAYVLGTHPCAPL